MIITRGALLVLSASFALADDTVLRLNSSTVHWGYFSKTLKPVLTINSGSSVTVEMATHHACDDFDKMIKGDPGMEDIFKWTGTAKDVAYRGATGAGDGVHILTGPIYVNGAEPGDILKVEILDLQPRKNPDGKTYGSNAAAWWGFQARVNKVDGTPFHAGSFTNTSDLNDEVVTIYQLKKIKGKNYAVPSYQFGWPVITDPDGVRRDYIKYPGTCVPHDPHASTIPSTSVADEGWTKEGPIDYDDSIFPARIPINFHVGNMGLAPASHDFVDSIPPMPTGGNLDNKRIGVGTTMYYPVEVAGALLSMGDAHAAQGDSELDGTGIETSITGKYRITVIKKKDFTAAQQVQDFPLGETATEWIVHGFTETDYLEKYADDPSAIYSASSLDPALKNAFTQTRKWLMAQYTLTSSEATTIITNAVDFAITQVVDGNWGVHAVIPKAVFVELDESAATTPKYKRRRKKAHIPLNAANVHWGYFSKTLPPVLHVNSGSKVIVEMATHHACDDYDLMINGDPGMEDIFKWTPTQKTESYRGATGSGDGVHIMTGPIYVNNAQPGDIIKVEILDLQPRRNPHGRTYGSNAAAWWGFQARVNKVDGTPFFSGSFTQTPDKDDEFITIYELLKEKGKNYAVPAYQFGWVNIIDPFGQERDYIAYPGTCVPHDKHGIYTPSGRVAEMGWKKTENITYNDNVFRARIPINFHVGNMGLAPASHDFVDSIPPMPSGGNLDNKRIGVGTTMYYKVEVPGGLLSMGDAHTAQGDSELDGTGIETSITGKFKITLIKPQQFTGGLKDLDFPLGETKDAWIVHGFTRTNYLASFAANPGEIYSVSNVDDTMKNAFTQTRKFLMAQYGLTETEVWTIVTQGVNFGITQVVDGNWGVHAIIPKSLFTTKKKRWPFTN